MRSPSLSIISALAAASCSGHGETCGPAGGSDLEIGGPIQAAYGDVVNEGANNDCPDPDAPTGVVSLTLTARELGDVGLLELCIRRPDQLAHMPGALGKDVVVGNLMGSAGGCGFSLDPTQPVSGVVTTAGLCDEGSAGFSIAIAGGQFTVERTCGSAVDAVGITLSGSATVTGS